MSKELLEQKTWRLEVITPIHIGGGDYHKLNKMDIVKDGGFWAILDEKKWATFLAERCLFADQDFLSFASQSAEQAAPARPGEGKKPRAPGLTDFLQAKELLGTLDRFTAYRLACQDYPNDLHPFIKDGDRQPYIPGSSLKGVLRTAVLYDQLLNSEELRRQVARQLDKGTPDWLLQTLQFDAGEDIPESLRDIMRSVRISDSLALGNPDDVLIICKKNDFNLKEDKEAPIPLFRECLKPQTSARIAVTLDHGLLERSPFHTIDDLYQILCRFGEALYQEFQEETKAHKGLLPPLSKPKSSLQQPQTAFASAFAEKGITSSQPGAIQEAIDSDKPNLNLGGGTGFQTKVLLKAIFKDDPQNYLEEKQRILQRQFPKVNRKNDQHVPRTIKLDKAGGKMLGWCHLSQE